FILTMSEDDPRRLEEIRRCAAIYSVPPPPTGSGKRKAASASAVSTLGPYELAVNEAAAQICRHVPALLSRREELFPLARQVVRDCAFNQFAKTDVECRSPAQTTAAGTPSASKRARAAELGFPAADKAQVEDERRKRQERLEYINEQLRSLGRQQEELKLRLGTVRDVALAAGIQQQLEQISHQQMQLLNDQNDVSKQLKRIEKFLWTTNKTTKYENNTREFRTHSQRPASQFKPMMSVSRLCFAPVLPHPREDVHSSNSYAPAASRVGSSPTLGTLKKRNARNPKPVSYGHQGHRAAPRGRCALSSSKRRADDAASARPDGTALLHVFPARIPSAVVRPLYADPYKKPVGHGSAVDNSGLCRSADFVEGRYDEKGRRTTIQVGFMFASIFVICRDRRRRPLCDSVVMASSMMANSCAEAAHPSRSWPPTSFPDGGHGEVIMPLAGGTSICEGPTEGAAAAAREEGANTEFVQQQQQQRQVGRDPFVVFPGALSGTLGSLIFPLAPPCSFMARSENYYALTRSEHPHDPFPASTRPLPPLLAQTPRTTPAKSSPAVRPMALGRSENETRGEVPSRFTLARAFDSVAPVASGRERANARQGARRRRRLDPAVSTLESRIEVEQKREDSPGMRMALTVGTGFSIFRSRTTTQKVRSGPRRPLVTRRAADGAPERRPDEKQLFLRNMAPHASRRSTGQTAVTLFFFWAAQRDVTIRPPPPPQRSLWQTSVGCSKKVLAFFVILSRKASGAGAGRTLLMPQTQPVANEQRYESLGYHLIIV
ncbi:hypothetical protein BIW11_12032, partial [Tropilaelaps mercedesae]